MEKALIDMIRIYCASMSWTETENVKSHLNSLNLERSELHRILIKILESCAAGTQTALIAFHICNAIPAHVDLGEKATHNLLDPEFYCTNVRILVQSNGHYFRSYMKGRKTYPCEIFEAYRDWAKAHDEWEEEDKELSYKCTFDDSG